MSDIPLLKGETPVLWIPGAHLLQKAGASRDTSQGDCLVTTFRLLHCSKTRAGAKASQVAGALHVGCYSLVQVPLTSIMSVSKKAIDSNTRQVKLYCKDMRLIKLTYAKRAGSSLHQYLQTWLPGNLPGPSHLFAYRYAGDREPWAVPDPRLEYTRMGIAGSLVQLRSARKREQAKEGSVDTSPEKSSEEPKAKKSRYKALKDWAPRGTTKKVSDLASSGGSAVGSLLAPVRKQHSPKQDNAALASTDPEEYSRRGRGHTQSLDARESIIWQSVSSSATGVRLGAIASASQNRAMGEIVGSGCQLSKSVAEGSFWKAASKSDSLTQSQCSVRTRETQLLHSRSTSLKDFERAFPPPQAPAPCRPSFPPPPGHAAPPPPPLLSPPPPRKGWAVVDVNKSYEFSASYPRYLCVPSHVTLEELQECFEFRSKGRIPVLTWRDPLGDACLLRSSQPLVGMGGNHSLGDEAYLRRVIDLNKTHKRLLIIDARDKYAASANHARGAGYEGSRYSEICDIKFMGIENIHTMRESLNKVFAALKHDDGSWLASLDSTGWLKHIRQILLAAQVVSRHITQGQSVLVHCSDGWDRTAQIVALAELLLDPFYRTFEGFQRLIEKDWLAFGHKFADRCGHGPGVQRTECSPVFVQWLDCVHQLIEQYPCSFEFNGDLLLFLSEEIYSCRFGTFVCNSTKECEELELTQQTAAIWAEIISHSHRYRNLLYARNPNVLKISASAKLIRFWHAFFLRWDRKMQPKECERMRMRFLCEEITRKQGLLKKMHEALLVKQAEQEELLSRWQRSSTSALKARSVSFTSSLRVMNMECKPVELLCRSVIEEALERAFAFIDAKEAQSVFSSGTAALLLPLGLDGSRQSLWVPDNWTNKCHSCLKKFKQLRRRHHCRQCGHVYCHACSKHKILIEDVSTEEPVRVCDMCFASVTASQFAGGARSSA